MRIGHCSAGWVPISFCFITDSIEQQRQRSTVDYSSTTCTFRNVLNPFRNPINQCIVRSSFTSLHFTSLHFTSLHPDILLTRPRSLFSLSPQLNPLLLSHPSSSKPVTKTSRHFSLRYREDSFIQSCFNYSGGLYVARVLCLVFCCCICCVRL